MKRLSNHILSLLRSYDQIVIPGLGIFSSVYSPASFNPSLNSFLPPQTDLEFIADSTATDGLLLNSYMRVEGLTSSEAERLVEGDIQRLLHLLHSLGEVSLEGLGKLYLYGSDIAFTPDYAFDFRLPEISLGAKVEPSIQEEEETPAPSVVEETIPEGYHYHKPHYYYIPVHKTVANIAASLLLVLVVAAVTLLPLSRQQSPTSAAYIAPVKLSEAPKIEMTTPAPSVAEEPVAHVEAATETAVEPVKETPKELKGYFAIVAAFKSMRQVKEYIASYPDCRFEVVDNGSYHLISAANADTREELEASLPGVKRAFDDVWIFEKK